MSQDRICRAYREAAFRAWAEYERRTRDNEEAARRHNELARAAYRATGPKISQRRGSQS